MLTCRSPPEADAPSFPNHRKWGEPVEVPGPQDEPEDWHWARAPKAA